MKNISDSVILYANILILLLLFVKFVAIPLIDSFKGRKKKQSEEFEDLEIRRKTILCEINDINQTLNEKQSGMESAKGRIIKQAEKKLFDNIKEAEHESDLILGRAKQNTESRIMQETEKLYKEIRSEILPESKGETSGKVSADTSKKRI